MFFLSALCGGWPISDTDEKRACSRKVVLNSMGYASWGFDNEDLDNDNIDDNDYKVNYDKMGTAGMSVALAWGRWEFVLGKWEYGIG